MKHVFVWTIWSDIFCTSTVIDGTHCYYDPSPPLCEPGYSEYIPSHELCLVATIQWRKRENLEEIHFL